MTRRLFLFFLLILLSVLTACGGDGMAVAPELIARDAVTARAFGRDQCYLTFPDPVPAYLNPNPEQAPAGDAPAGEAEAVQAVSLRDGSLWYQLTDGVWVRVDTVDYTTRGDCQP